MTIIGSNRQEFCVARTAHTTVVVAEARPSSARGGARSLADQTGMSYVHLRAVANGYEPMTFTDARDLAAALGVPAPWLRDGWSDDTIEFSPGTHQP
jgi:hypothetical protein